MLIGEVARSCKGVLLVRMVVSCGMYSAVPFVRFG